MPAPELSVRLLREGYLALPHAWDSWERRSGEAGQAGQDWPLAMPARLLGRRALVVRGEEGARLFYDQDLTSREGVVPRPLAGLLFGHGAVHGLDGSAHLARKELFLQALGAERVACLGDLVEEALVQAVSSWGSRSEVNVFDELVQVYGGSVLPWAGITPRPRDVALTSRRLSWIVDGFGFAGAAYLRGWWGRLRTNAWLRERVREARDGRRTPPPGSMLHVLSAGPGAELAVETAAVELGNVVRPTVAVAWLGTFAAQALTEHPGYGARMRGPDGARWRWAFAQEVRRHRLFVPALAARVDRPVTWQGHRLEAGDRVVLDVPGTDADPRRYPDPDQFRPERFLDRRPGAYDLVPQGGGEVRTGHRCPGEDVALVLLERTLQVLAELPFTVASAPTDWTRIPALPPGGLRVVEAGSLLRQ